MKKIFLITLVSLSCMVANAQMRVVNAAYSEARNEKPNFGNARDLIKEALVNDETKEVAKTWYVAGFIENKAFEVERNKQILNQKPNEEAMYTALMAAYSYFIKAAELDQIPNEKGKVKPRYLKDIKSTLKNIQSDYVSAGAFYFDQKKFDVAYNNFKVYIDIPDLPYMASEKIVKDTTYTKIKYYAAISSTQMNDHQLAIKTLSALKNDNYNENEIYQYLAYEYEQLKDTVGLTAILKEGVTKFKSEPYYIQNLINIYIYSNQLDEAIKYLDMALESEPENVQFIDVKGRLYESKKEDAKAIECYEKAIKINPEYADALGNLGRMYYNMAVQLNSDVNEIKDNKLFNQKKNEVVLPAFKKALPYYEKAHSLKPDEREYMVALRGIYYNLNMGKEFQAIEVEMKPE